MCVEYRLRFDNVSNITRGVSNVLHVFDRFGYVSCQKCIKTSNTCLSNITPTPGSKIYDTPFTTTVNETRFCLHHSERYQSHPTGTYIQRGSRENIPIVFLKISKFFKVI